MSLTGWIALAMAGLTALGVFAIIRHHLGPRKEREPRGTAPGDGDTLVYARERVAFLGAGNADAAGRMTRVTKDPQQYAKGMMPGRRK